MSAANLATSAYKTSTKATSTPRGAEYQVLSRINGALTAGEANKNENWPAYIRVLSDNLRFWTIVGCDVASETNPLPRELRAQLFYLFEYTRDHTNKILQGDKTRTAEPLIDINKNILIGLKTTPPKQVT